MPGLKALLGIILTLDPQPQRSDQTVTTEFPLLTMAIMLRVIFR